jgi:hypothetical protein
MPPSSGHKYIKKGRYVPDHLFFAARKAMIPKATRIKGRERKGIPGLEGISGISWSPVVGRTAVVPPGAGVPIIGVCDSPVALV